MRLPVSSDVILSELAAARAVIEKWERTVGSGIPGVDLPGNEDVTEGFVTEMCGELLVVAGKCQTLAEVIYGR